MNHRTNQTQAEIARKMGVTQTDVSRIENKEKCTLPMFKSYLRACGKEVVIAPIADVLKEETITGLKMRVIKLLAEKQECARNLMKQAVKMEGLQVVTEQQEEEIEFLNKLTESLLEQIKQNEER